jgi:alkylation response protein AidB-like acyl-CoA dehydrogenase
MDYDLSSEQNILKESAHKLLAKECPSEFVREMAEDETGYSKKLWEKMADLGWMSLLVPETYDGSGVNFLDLSIILSEFGYYCVPGPFFSTVVLGGLPILTAGSDAQKTELLPEIATGKRKLTLAWLEQEELYQPSGIQLTAEKTATGFTLDGTKLFVPDAHLADTIICVARTASEANSISLFIVDATLPGIHLTSLETMSGDKQYEVRFEKVAIPADRLLGELNGAWPVLEEILLKAAVAKCAEMAGGADKVMDLVIPYVKGRKQFGKPVGAFQAVQHHCANMLTFQDTNKFMLYQAAWRISEGLPFAAEAAMCKAWVNESHAKLVGLGHQIVGGLGFMEEYDLQLYFKRARTAAQMFGSSDDHREIVAREMGL